MRRKRRSIVDKYADSIFDIQYEHQTAEGLLDLRRFAGCTKMRCRTWKCGDMQEIEIYPVYDNHKGTRAARTKISREVQKKLNRKNAVKKIVRLINTNFTADIDTWIHLPYNNNCRPMTVVEASKIMRRYIRRLKRYAAKMGWTELKYIYTTEGGGNTKKNIHHHLVINFPDRDVAEKLWTWASYPRANRLRDSEFKFAGMAHYMGKDTQGSKRYVSSHNLLKPIPHEVDYKYSRSKVLNIINGRIDAKELFEKDYKGYRYLAHESYISDYISGAYLYVQMRC